MNITADTNILVRLLVNDDPAQPAAVKPILSRAGRICIPTSVFCELVWVLSHSYRFSRKDISWAVRGLLQTDNLVCHTGEILAGLALLEAGGDFADGVNKYAGRHLGADTFVTFDRKAALLLRNRGRKVTVP
ncbi:type II toxin-antitoxin system VapC family toxin [Neisseria musculi]|uniref:Ribonuclease VapC n=1 Tax=Neisseria musculi TaxID=1815583 RepID=A0A7H1MDZ1_9NEIS|nr:type II toxin-antitoxin system VapC family toxin [Neisseria musculi]QNT59856.1 PIN domain protein [Neisseria musculi]